MACRAAHGIVLAIGFFTSTALGQVINSTDCGDGTVTMWATWEMWSGLSGCSVMCVGETGESSRQRSRACPVPVTTCDAQQFEVEYYQCQGSDPATDGGLGTWSQWADSGSCNALCGKGQLQQTRSRACDSPVPICGGSMCTGLGVLTEQRKVGCVAGACGRRCIGLSRPRVLSTTDTSGFYLLCFRRSITRVPCPAPFNFRAYFIYGFINAIRMYRVCN